MAAPLILAAAGTGLQMFGKIRQGQLDKAMSKINARRLENEAVAIVDQAREDVRVGRSAQEAHRGSIIASFAARGIDVGSETPADFVLTQARIDEYNNARTLFEAELKATELAYQAKVTRFSGKTAQENAILGAFGSLMSGGGNALYTGALKPNAD